LSIATVFVGCAGWSIGREHAPAFPADGTHLQRYALRLNAVEINSSFYRPHRPQTYRRWAESVPPAFRFSVKIPKLISHERRLQHCEQPLDEFLGQCMALGERLGCLLLQLPPKLSCDASVAEAFFIQLRERYRGPLVLEPRHESWVQAAPMLAAHGITQAAVDPSRISNDAAPLGGAGLNIGLEYWRLHGAPRIYHSPYDEAYLQRLADDLLSSALAGRQAWCIFDNTASGAATANALRLRAILDHRIGTS